MSSRKEQKKLTVGKALVESGKFVVGVPLGFVVGIIPLIGFPLGFLALQSISGIERGRDEDWESFEDRKDRQKPYESFMYGIDTGVVIGWIAQVAYLAN